MTEPPYPWTTYPPSDAAVRRPGVVQAAAIVTWVGAGATAVFTVLLTAAYLWLARAVFDSFEPGLNNPRWWLVGAALVILLLCAAAALLAHRVWRGERWAWWGLLVLSALAAFVGILTASAVVPVVVAGLAITTMVLLLLDDSRAWTRRTG